MKRSRLALIQSVISLILCLSMLAGTTFAWFTDSASSEGNIIKSGNLKISMKWTADLENQNWQDASKVAIFDYSNWEPGYTDLKYLQISNDGNLAFQYQLTLEEGPAPKNGISADGGEPAETQEMILDGGKVAANDETGGDAGIITDGGTVTPGAAVSDAMKLAEVIDVYYLDATDKIITRQDAIDKMKHVGTLADLIRTQKAATQGVLLPAPSLFSGDAEPPSTMTTHTGSTTAAIMLKMRKDAGNAYMGLSPENGYCVKVFATQYSHEEDSFGKDYDSAVALPSFSGSVSGTAAVGTDENGLTTAEVSIGDEAGGATVPAGVQVNEGTTELTLAVSQKESSDSGITKGENENLIPLEVHIEGISPNNTTPIRVNLGKILPEGMNIGNVNLYHVEDGATNPMTQVLTLEELDTHNEFYYDPATGHVTVSMATFSEIAVVSDTENAWGGKFDYTWYDADAKELTIANADQLAAFGAIVGGMNGQTQDSFAGKTVKLIADINLGDAEAKNNPNLIFYPIGYNCSDGTYEKTNGAVTTGFYNFEGTFDGQGHTIANFYQNTWEMKGDNEYYDDSLQYYRDGMGLFGKVYGGTVKNLRVENFSSDGEYTTTGVIAAYADSTAEKSAVFENIAIVNCNPRVYNIGNGGIVGCGGWYSKDNKVGNSIKFKNITVDKTNKISALWGSYDVACGGIMGQYYPNSGCGVSFENCNMAAQMDVYNDVCGNYQYYAYRYAGMMIGSIRANLPADDKGHIYPDMTGITAKNCTVNYGDWNDYYYCEYVSNGKPSYAKPGEYKFSRVDNRDIDTSKGKNNATCNHDHIEGEDQLAVYLPFHQLFTGHGWGVTSKGLDDFEGIDTIEINVSDKNTSGVKFNCVFPESSVDEQTGVVTTDFLYRVGNRNEISVGSLFTAVDGASINGSGVYVTITSQIDDEIIMGNFTAPKADSNGEVKWQDGKIKFNQTGVVKVTIQDYDYCTTTVLYLEVVDAYNRTTASFNGNSVLLNDVSTSSTLSTSGVIYGNGFTVNVENAPISEKNGAVFHLYDGAVLKNLNIVGKEFTTVAKTVNDTNYGVSAVRAWGTVTIENCYISGCRSAVSVTGSELTIKDSVIANGVYANIDFRSGILNLHNVTTINEPHDVNGTKVVGLGIVGNMTASAGRKINITGTLTQYNWVSKADCSNIKATGIDSIFNSVFTDSRYANLRYTYNGTTYVNTGILSLCSDFGKDAVTGVPDTYSGMEVTASISEISGNGYVWAPGQAGTLSDNDMKYHDAQYNADDENKDQGTAYIPPAFNFEAAGLETEEGVVQISYERGSSYTLSAETLKKLLTPQKYGQVLPLKISMNGTDYTDKDIVFNGTESNYYTVVYTITDNIVYDSNGNKVDTTYEVLKELKVFATVVDKSAAAPTFTFYYGTNGSASAGTPHVTQPTDSYTGTIKQIGETYYIMPNVSATSANEIGSKTVDGIMVYYPIVDGINARSGSSTDYDFTRYYPVFKAVEISDNGTAYTYNDTKEMPATVSWVSAEIDSGNGASSLNDGFGLYNNQYLCKIQKKAGDAEAGGTSVVKYSYTAMDGNTYNYYVGYRFYDESEGCVTPDTLITLANGKQVRVDSLTGNEQLLVWNMETGKLDSAPIMFVDSDPKAAYKVIHLYFSDGTDVKVISEHGFWDYDLNRYVYLDRNADKYIGHTFAKQSGSKLAKVKLTDVVLETEVTTAWSPVTAGHLCYFVNGMLSMPGGVGGLFNIFEVNPATMTYDYEAMARDIETYGLFTYEEMNAMVPLSEDMFNAAGGAYLKISIGKGNMTLDDLVNMIQRYSKYI